MIARREVCTGADDRSNVCITLRAETPQEDLIIRDLAKELRRGVLAIGKDAAYHELCFASVSLDKFCVRDVHNHNLVWCKGVAEDGVDEYDFRPVIHYDDLRIHWMCTRFGAEELVKVVNCTRNIKAEVFER